MRAFWLSQRIGLLSLLVVLVSFVCPGVASEKQAEVKKSAPAKTEVQFDDHAVLPAHGTAAGFWLFAESDSPQVALMGHPADRAIVALRKGDRVTFLVPVPGEKDQAGQLELRAVLMDGSTAKVALKSDNTEQKPVEVVLAEGVSTPVRFDGLLPSRIRIEFLAEKGPATVRLDHLTFKRGEKTENLSLDPRRRTYTGAPVASSPALLPVMEKTLLEWDWRMQDGIGAPREPVGYVEAIRRTFERGDRLVADLTEEGVDLGAKLEAWKTLSKKFEALSAAKETTDAEWESLWLAVHRARRELVLSNPLSDVGPLLFAKRVPSIMSHQLTQYYGYTARPGGGLFVLDRPGRSMQARELTAGKLPEGSLTKPEISFDGKTIYFGFCEAPQAPVKWSDPAVMGRRYHLYAIGSDGMNVRQLTDGDYDDFAPICLPDGRLMFSSTRRGGFHRCGSGPCYVYTLAIAEADGSNPTPVSFHETNEWDPVVLHDGRVVYTRWDYVDRDAIYYQQLWGVRQDGSDVRIYYGNNTFNPVGIWETRPVPGSHRVMATASPHHGMTAGSIILLDVTRGVDGPDPIKRLTPEVLFPESEGPLAHGPRAPEPVDFDTQPTRFWKAPRDPNRRTEMPVEQRRWPGHCYRAPYPLSENYFLASYSFDRQLGEMGANLPNLFGIYLVDAFGNKELLYRDPNLSSQWVMPLAPRKSPPQTPTTVAIDPKNPTPKRGTFFLQNVYESWPKLPDEKIDRLRIVQVLPKTTPHANQPTVGVPFASPAKQVLGTVPVEADGSAYFEAPSGIGLAFQALDKQGRAVQVMRSLTYLQPGERVSCVGCHESRMGTPMPTGNPIAGGREPSKITPGPDGSKPMSYPLLVQGVLDRHCVQCHNNEKPEGKLVLTAEPEGRYTKSYNGLIKHVSYSAWTGPNGNYEPMTEPDRFGARGSRLIKLLDAGHYDVKLSGEDWERIVTWIDANGLFYGTFNVEEQAKQQRGERIVGPDLE